MFAVLAIVVACLCAGWVLKSLLAQLLSANQQEVAPQGVLAAGKRWLEDNDYEILPVPKDARYCSSIDHSTIDYQERADFIARKDGREYAVVVGLETPPNEWLCQHYFPLYMILDVDGLIFLNLTEESVCHVDFTVYRSRRYRFRRIVYRSMWFASGALVMFAWLHRV